MRAPVDETKLRAFFEGIGRAAQGPGKIYLTGGSTALLLGIRKQTIDIDLKMDPEPKGVFEAIAHLKEELDINIELASPDDFLPPLPGWKERSEFIARSGEVEFFNYDAYAQALSKIARGHDVDLADARSLHTLGKVELGKLVELFESIEPELIRYPAIDPRELRRRVEEFVTESEGIH